MTREKNQLAAAKRMDQRPVPTLPPLPFAIQSDRECTRPYDRRSALGQITRPVRMPTAPADRVLALKRIIAEVLQ